MIKIKQLKNKDEVQVVVGEKDSPITVLLGCSALIDVLLEGIPDMSIDDVLSDLKSIYIRDKEGEKENA